MRGIFAAGILSLVAWSVQAEVVMEAVEFTDGDDQYTGYMAYDNAVKEKRPGILVVHQWWGVSEYEKSRARQLAEMGYVAFAMDMYGTGKLTDKSSQAQEWMLGVTADVEGWRDQANLGIDILKKSVHVDADRIAAIGYCFGGGTMLQMAYGGTDIKGVVSFHGSLPAADAEAQAAIKTKMLILHGDADPFVSDEVEAGFRSALAKTQVDWQMVNYGGVLHSFTDPEAGTHGMDALKYDPVADARSWRAMQNFFDEIFAQ